MAGGRVSARLVAPGVQESVLNFSIASTPSLGVLAEPIDPAADIAVLILVGGPQYRVGAHRHFVLLARHLAAAGFACLRFDHRGLGDCVAPLRTFEALDDDIDAAIQALLQARPALKGVVLWGLCDGASAALLYCARRPATAVRGLVLLNPWVRSAQTEAATRIKHYYWQRLRSPAFWRKLLGGGVGLRALSGWWQARQLARSGSQVSADKAQPYQDLMAHAWQRPIGPLLLQLCPADFTAQEFLESAQARPSWSGWQLRAQLQRNDYPSADHTFSQAAALSESFTHTVSWLRQHFAGSSQP